MIPSVKILVGDCRAVLKTLPEKLVHLCCTSPPYWSLRDYGTEPQIWGGSEDCVHEWGLEVPGDNRGGSGSPTGRNGRGENYARDNTRGAHCQTCGAWRGSLGLEPTPEMFISHLVDVFRELRRVLRDDGVLAVNMGDSYCSKPSGGIGVDSTLSGSLEGQQEYRKARRHRASFRRDREMTGSVSHIAAPGLKPKDLCGIPWALAFALRDDGWFLRSDIPWVRRTAMPESVEDRPAKSLEYIFLLAKSDRYYWDNEAVRRAASGITGGAAFGKISLEGPGSRECTAADRERYAATGRNFRNGDLWFESIAEPHGLCSLDDELVGLDVNPEPLADAHFAAFPRRLVEPFVKAGTSERGCCPKCGKCWDRVVECGEKVAIDGRPNPRDTGWNATNGSPASEVGILTRAGHTIIPKAAIGWQASCDCPELAPVPCVVLDPFGGSGTVGLVAKALGRDYVLIELKPEYAEIAKRRIARGYETGPKQEVVVGQKELF